MQDSFLSLIEINSARTFLRKALKIIYSKNGRINYADFSRRCQFSSRSFVGEYLKNEKQLSPESLRKIINGAKLPRNYSTLFRYLVYLDNKSIAPKDMNKKILTEKIRDLRKKIRIEAKIDFDPDKKRITENIAFFKVYAALGEITKGNTLEKISQKTKLTQKNAQNILQQLENLNIVKKQEDRYFVVSSKLDLQSFSGEKIEKEIIQEVCTDIITKKDIIVENKHNALIYAAVSVNNWDMPKIKKEMEDAVFEILDKYQSDEGNVIAQIFTVSHAQI